MVFEQHETTFDLTLKTFKIGKTCFYFLPGPFLRVDLKLAKTRDFWESGNIEQQEKGDAKYISEASYYFTANKYYASENKKYTMLLQKNSNK